ncbi:MAG: thiamine pyrophosphate-binding protein [Myxococcales bacterium]|nr:thiamine pyrophosphate-binding protein [Myxococcales bacterium]
MSVDGGAIIGKTLADQGVKYLFTLCGGHISPILVGAKAEGIKVVDVRDEVSSVFAADAVGRMTGVPGVAAVTAGPGVTNTITAVKNAEMAQTPLVIFGGATATILRGRGSLQDIDQMTLMKPLCKWVARVTTVAALRPTVEKAFEIAMSGVPGPVFIEVPIDLLYPESVVKKWYLTEAGLDDPKGLGPKAMALFLKGHLAKQFHAPHVDLSLPTPDLKIPFLDDEQSKLDSVAAEVAKAERPVLVVGAQALVNLDPSQAEALAESVNHLGIPTYLAGTARGLLGRFNGIQFRHARKAALKAADLVIIAGFPFDFRLGYGRIIPKRATLIAANLSKTDLRKNRRPDIGLNMHPGEFLNRLAVLADGKRPSWEPWFEQMKEREDARDAEIIEQASESSELVNPLKFFTALEEKMTDDAVLVVDGGDFVATAAYILRPRAPLSWLDPGVFGTLGVGGGFALGAALCRPKTEVWLIWGDGSSAYSLAEFDTYVRHGLAPIAVIGTDASWAQIARDQVEILGDSIGTELLRTDYHKVAEGYGGVGLLLDDESKIDAVLDEAKALSASGKPVVINVHIGGSDFRKGSISV